MRSSMGVLIGLGLAALTVACASKGTPADTANPGEDCGDPAATHTVVLTELSFTRIADDGTIEGFDLDRTVSDAGDPAGCGHADRTSADGRAGIDSAFATLVPVLEGLGAGAVEGLIQQAIDSGELLVLIELTHIDTRIDDPCVEAHLHRGEGSPILGTDGTILVDQTFGVSDEVPSSFSDDGSVSGRVFEVRGIEVTLPVQILDVFLTFTMPQGAIQMTIEPDGTVQGHIAGGVPVEQITSQIGAITDIGDLSTVIPPLIEAAADLYPDAEGQCTALSLGFDFRGTPAFILREP